MSLTHNYRKYDADDFVSDTMLDGQPSEALFRDVWQRPFERPQEVPARRAEKPKEIEWSNNLGESIAKARDGKKPLVVEFTADWCTYCKSFENFILPNQTVQDFANEAVFVQAKPESDPAAMDAARSLNITAYPTTVILDAVGQELRERGRIVGYRPLGQFVQEFKMGMDLPVPTEVPADTLPPVTIDDQGPRIV